MLLLETLKLYTASQKHESTLLHSPYVCTERVFDSRPFKYNKTVIIVGTYHLNASFGIFYIHIGQLFEAQ